MDAEDSEEKKGLSRKEDADEAKAPGDVRAAADDVIDATAAFTVESGRSRHDHESGTPQSRDFVRGDDDPRDAALAEHPLSEDTVWTGKIFSVNRLQVKLPDGRTAIRDVVRHCGAVAVVALTDDGRICLVRQYRTALGRVTVEIPAGKLDPGEDPLHCAHRELEEETGFTAKKMAYLTSIASSDGFTDEIIHLYMATGLEFAEASPDDDEFINVDLVELSQLIDAVLDGQVEDAKTIVGALACDAVARRLNPEK